MHLLCPQTKHDRWNMVLIKSCWVFYQNKINEFWSFTRTGAMNNNYILTLQLKCEFGFNLHKTNHILLLHVYSTISCRRVPITESVTHWAVFMLHQFYGIIWLSWFLLHEASGDDYWFVVVVYEQNRNNLNVIITICQYDWRLNKTYFSVWCYEFKVASTWLPQVNYKNIIKCISCNSPLGSGTEDKLPV